MKLYSSFGPNPAVVTAFLRERGATLETVVLEMGQSRQPPYIDWNPAGGMPVLELDDGDHLAESLAICEYLDELLPGESLIGTSPEARAVTRMWIRRIDIGFVQPASNGWRYDEGVELCRSIMHVIPQASQDLKKIAAQHLIWLNEHIKTDFICGERPTLADILLFVFVEFGAAQGQPIDPALLWIASWRARMSARPLAETVNMRVAL